MLRRSALLALILIAAVMPLNASAATSQTVRVTAYGQPSTNWYYYSSTICSTSNSYVTYMYRGGPSFQASGITPTSGAVYEYFDAVGPSVWGKAYFFQGSPNRAFEFWFEGTLQCPSRTYGVVRGNWTFGYLYAADPATGQLNCTRLDGRGTVEVRVDFLRKTTQTVLYGSYTQGATQPCQS